MFVGWAAWPVHVLNSSNNNSNTETETRVYKNVLNLISCIWNMSKRRLQRSPQKQVDTDDFVSFYKFCKYVWFVYHLGIFIWQRFIFKYEIKMINY